MNVEKLTWYVARSGGIVAWVLLAAGIVLGLLLSSRVLGRKASPAWILSVHRYLGGLAVIFTGVHVAAIMLDDFVDFGFVEVLVPMASSWRPGAVAWGIVAMYLMVAIELTSFAMKRLPREIWRAVHWTSAPLFAFATVHGYQAGTDAGRAFMIAIVGTCIVLTALTAIRIVGARRAADESRTDPRKLVAEAKALKNGDREQIEIGPAGDRLDAGPLSEPDPNAVIGAPEVPSPVADRDAAASAWIQSGDWPEQPSEVASDRTSSTTPSEVAKTAAPQPSWESPPDARPEMPAEPLGSDLASTPPRPDWELPLAGLAEEQPADGGTSTPEVASIPDSPFSGIGEEGPPELPPKQVDSPPARPDEAVAAIPSEPADSPFSDLVTPTAAERSPLSGLPDVTPTQADPRDRRSPGAGHTEEKSPLSDLGWLDEDPLDSAIVDRREGPVPGVWKRSKTDRELTPSSD